MIMVWVCDSLSAQNKEGHFSLKYRCQKHEHILGAEASCRQSNLRCHANTFFGRQAEKKKKCFGSQNEWDPWWNISWYIDGFLIVKAQDDLQEWGSKEMHFCCVICGADDVLCNNIMVIHLLFWFFCCVIKELEYCEKKWILSWWISILFPWW